MKRYFVVRSILYGGVGVLTGAIASIAIYLVSTSATVPDTVSEEQSTQLTHSQKVPNAAPHPAGQVADYGGGPVPSMRALAIASQIKAGITNGMPERLWIPLDVAKYLGFKVGSMSGNFKLDPQARNALALTDLSATMVEDSVNEFMREVRGDEVKAANYTVLSDKLTVIEIPAQFVPAESVQSFANKIYDAVGEDAAKLLLPRLESEVDKVSPVFNQEARKITISIDDNDEVTTRLNNAEYNHLPDYLKHLLKVEGDPIPNDKPADNRPPSSRL